MVMMKKTAHEQFYFDPACQDLAEHFLADEPYNRETAKVHQDRVRRLAHAIQIAVEEFFIDCPPEPSR